MKKKFIKDKVMNLKSLIIEKAYATHAPLQAMALKMKFNFY